jgi:hypothetical protein
LRAELGLTDAMDPNDSVRVMNAKRKIRAAYAELTEARNKIHGIQVEVGEIRGRSGLGSGLGALIPPRPRNGEEAHMRGLELQRQAEEAASRPEQEGSASKVELSLGADQRAAAPLRS